MSISPIRCLLSSVAFCGSFAASSFATDYYVSTGGLDTNPGTQAQPWRHVQKAANIVAAGDTVHIRAGTYAERVTIDSVLGTISQPVVFQKFAADAGTVIIDQTGVTPPDGQSALLTIQDSNYITIKNLEFANYKTAGSPAAQMAQNPGGIFVTGACDGVKLLNCKVHDIWQSSTIADDFGVNGFGVLVYGYTDTPIDNFVMDGCEVYNLRTGATESVALNGNVTHFAVSHNTIHDCNNIGIDFIGFEETGPLGKDQARNGTCSDNLVYNIDSKFNPAYGGNFTTGGADSTRSAPGLYVDGGRDIVMERNHVYGCNFALSIGSEHFGKVATNITVRDNIFHHCHVGGIVTGGSSDVDNGGATNCDFTNNTLYNNDTTGSGGGQFSVQNFVTGCTIKRNVLSASSSFVQFIVAAAATSNFTAGAIDWNLYRCGPAASFEFIYQGNANSTFAAWKSNGGVAKDAHSSLITTAVGWVNDTPTATSPATDFALTASSPAKDVGDSAGLPFTPASGETDFFGNARVINIRVDIGASERPVASAWEIWLTGYFGGSTGPNTAPADDPDKDGVSNLIEYSQGRDPTVKENTPVPGIADVGSNVRISYRKAVAGLTYELQQSTGIKTTWTAVTTTESTDGAGLYSREVRRTGPRKFFRLQVTLP